MGKKKFSKNSYNKHNSSPIKTRALTRKLKQNSQQLEIAKTGISQINQQLEINANNQKKNNSEVKMDKSKFDMLLLHLSTYDGRKENNISFYIKQFEDLAKDMDIEDAQKVIILKAKFSGPARETLINSPELCNEDDFEQLKKKLIEEFQPRKSMEEIQNDFKNLKQRPEQSIEEFAKIFKLKASKYIQKVGSADKQDAQDFFDKIKLQEFLNMIRPDIAVDVRKTAPQSLQEAINKSKQIEAALNSIPKIEAVNNHAANETLLNITSTQMEEINKLKEQVRELKLLNQGKKNKDEYCAICKIKSHDTDNCYYNSRNKVRPKQYRNDYQNRNQHQEKDRNMTFNYPYAGHQQNMMPMLFPQVGYSQNQNYAMMQQPLNSYASQGACQNEENGQKENYRNNHWKQNNYRHNNNSNYRGKKKYDPTRKEQGN